MPEARLRLREARDRLSRHDFVVGSFYFRLKNYAGAVSRFREILDNDPAYTGRDEVYFYLAESLATVNRVSEAIPYLARILDEFDSSEFAEQARSRLTELEAGEDR
jgi:outer membrane protein assembly factor BamD